jgi:hypothetical protein
MLYLITYCWKKGWSVMMVVVVGYDGDYISIRKYRRRSHRCRHWLQFFWCYFDAQVRFSNKLARLNDVVVSALF